MVEKKAGYQFKQPGAMSKTRWMAKAIYSLKTWMFGKALKLARGLEKNMFDLNVFICRSYVRAWFLAPLASQAPRNDLSLLKQFYANKDLGKHWEAALKKMADHLWYLSPMLVVMSLFDKEVSLDEKRQIVAKFQVGNNDVPPVRPTITLDDSINDLSLCNFACKQSLRFFNATGISSGFLSKDPLLWETDNDFQKGLKIVSSFSIVNDAAERGVQLISKFIKGNNLTTDEEERQRLLLVVSEDRKRNKLR